MTTTEEENGFIQAFNGLANQVHNTAQVKGWWDPNPLLMEAANVITAHAATMKDGTQEAYDTATLAQDMVTLAHKRNDGEVLALIHSEVSEALEALRHGNPHDDKIPEFSGAEAELADVIIRIMDVSVARGWRVAEAVVFKARMNTTRTRKHGGKEF